MPDATENEAASGAPKGPPRLAWFAGIVEGPRGEDDELQRLTDEINGLGMAPVDLDLDGGRFSILFGEDTLTGEQFRVERTERFLQLLQQLVDSLPEEGSLESTLRCTAVFEDQAVESAFAQVGRDVRCVSRVRQLTEADLRRAQSQGTREQVPLLGNMGRRGAAILTILLVLVFGVMAWRGGLIDRVFAADAVALEVHAGSFGNMLDVAVASSWGNYEITLKRGPDYPTTAAQVDAMLEAAATPQDRATVNVVSSGTQIYLRLENEAGTVLASRRVELGSLLAEADAKVSASLPGRISAHHLTLALDPGKDR